VADYAGAMSARRIGALWTSLGMQAVGAVTLAVTLLALGRWPVITAETLPWAAILAISGGLPLWLLYRALALGPISVVSPVVASYAALTVILVVIFLGETLSEAQAIAIGITFVGVVLSTTDVRTFVATIGRPLPGVRLGILATLGFAVWGALLAAGTKQHDGLALIVLWRTMAVMGLAVIALVGRRGVTLPVPPSTIALVVGVGIFDTLGNVAFVFGVNAGQAAVTATGSGLYPIIPALLGIGLLGERLAPNQYLGIAITVAGLVTLAVRG
jgi:drug/metabolite transporter (DMT)-like permease